MADAPHFALPFRLTAAGAMVNEQDTIEDIADCVYAIMVTHVGWRDEVPSFGVPDMTFNRIPIGANDVLAMIGDQEPRAVLMVSERPDALDKLVDNIRVFVSINAKGASQ